MDYNSIDILLVEDSQEDAELAMRELKKNKMSLNIFHLKDGEEALDFIFATGQFAGKRDIKSVPRLILLDLQMPRVSGIEVLEKIKGDESTSDIPVVVLTSSNQNLDIKKSYALGVNSYIIKPVNFDEYSRAIKDLGLYWLLLNRPPE